MANRARLVCLYPGCSALALVGHTRCAKHNKDRSADGDAAQKSKAYDQARYHDEHRALYRTASWLRLRNVQLLEHPLCAECERRKIITPATDVDHIRPHRGDRDLFFDSDNLQSLCKSCHSTKTGRGE